MVPKLEKFFSLIKNGSQKKEGLLFEQNFLLKRRVCIHLLQYKHIYLLKYYKKRNFIQKLYAKIYAQHNLIQLQDVYIICDDFFFYYSWYLKLL
jgi:hypothetical protein